MNRSTLLKRLFVSVALILLGMLLSWVLLGGGVEGVLKGRAPAGAQAAAAPPSTAYQHDLNQDSFVCTAKAVAVYPERIHVECTQAAGGGISFFALGTSDSSHAARVLTLLSMAQVTGQPLLIAYDQNDTSGEAIGCEPTDCRLIKIVTLLP